MPETLTKAQRHYRAKQYSIFTNKNKGVKRTEVNALPFHAFNCILIFNTVYGHLNTARSLLRIESGITVTIAGHSPKHIPKKKYIADYTEKNMEENDS